MIHETVGDEEATVEEAQYLFLNDSSILQSNNNHGYDTSRVYNQLFGKLKRSLIFLLFGLGSLGKKFFLICRYYFMLFWFRHPTSVHPPSKLDRQRRKVDVPLNIAISLVVLFFLFMTYSLLAPTTPMGWSYFYTISKNYQPDPNNPLTMVSYYSADGQHSQNADLKECSSGYGLRNSEFNRAKCIQRIQLLQQNAGWTEAALRIQETKLLHKENLPCLCSPMYGSSFPRLVMPTATGGILHCLAPRVTLSTKEYSSIIQKLKLFPEELNAGGKRVTRPHYATLLCLQPQQQKTSNVIYEGEEILRHLSGPTAHCAQLCIELLTGSIV